MNINIKKIKIKIKKEKIILLSILSILTSVSFLSIFGFGINYYNNQNESTSLAIKEYLKQNNEEKTYGQLEITNPAKDISTLNRFLISVTVNKSYAETNKSYILSKPTDSYTPLKLTYTKPSAEVLTPNLIIFPNGNVKKDYFNFPLVNEQKWDFEMSSGSQIFISKNVADAYIGNSEEKNLTYDKLIGKAMSGQVTRAGSTFTHTGFKIRGVIDTDHKDFDFYRAAFGDTIVVASYNSLTYYFDHASMIFELGKNQVSNPAFIKIIHDFVEKAPEDYKYSILEKNSDGQYALGKINEASSYANTYFTSAKTRKKATLYLVFTIIPALLYFAAIVVFSIIRKRQRDNTSQPLALDVLGVNVVSFTLVSIIIFAINRYYIGSGFFVPFNSTLPSMTALFYFAFIFISTLICALLLAPKKSNAKKKAV